jgi:RNA polymerase sigma factor (sigma-70 family)
VIKLEGVSMKAEDLSVADIERLDRIADFVATKYFFRQGMHVEKDEFYQACWLGFLLGLHAYDPARSQLVTFARLKMEFACQDHLRAEDHLTRAYRRKINAGETVAHEHMHSVAMDLAELPQALVAETESGFDSVERQVTLAAFEDWMSGAHWFTDRFAEIYRLRKSGLTMKAVADRIGVTESYISMVETRIRNYGERWGRGDYKMTSMTPEAEEVAQLKKQLLELQRAYKRLDEHAATQLGDLKDQNRVLVRRLERYRVSAKSLLTTRTLIRYRNTPEVRAIRESLELTEEIYLGHVHEEFLDLRKEPAVGGSDA